MVPLTTFLADKLLEDVPAHSIFPAQPFPEGAQLKGLPECHGCPIYQNNTTPGHQSCGKLVTTQPLDPVHKINVNDLRAMRDFVRFLYRLAMPFYGLNPGFLFNGSGSANWIDGVRWEIIAVWSDEDGDHIKVKTGDGSDCKRRPIITAAPNRLGVTQPGDYGNVDVPSVLNTKAWPRVIRVVFGPDDNYGLALDEAIFDLNMPINAAMFSSDPANPNPETYYFTTYREAGDPERWDEVVQLAPSLMYTKQRKATFFPDVMSMQFEDGGRFVLKAPGNKDAAISEPIEDRFIVRKMVAGEWVDISGLAASRIYTIRTGEGDDQLGVRKTTLCLGSVDIFDVELESLIADAERVEVTYYAHVPSGTFGSCGNSIIRCAHCKLDTTDSRFGNPNAEAWDGENRHWYCNRANYSPGEGEPQSAKPRGVTEGLFGVNCYLPGVCEQHTYMHEEDIFSIKRDMARWIANLMFAQSLRVQQLAAGSSSHLNWFVTRILHASIMMLYDEWPLDSTAGFVSRSFFPESGCGYIGEYEFVTDEAGDEHIVPVRGAYEDVRTNLSDLEFDHTGPPPGAISSLPGWRDKESPYREPLDETTDPHELARNHTHRDGPQVQRATGLLQGRFANRWPRLHPAQPLLVPKINLNLVNVDQVRGNMTVKVLDPPMEIDGQIYDLLFTLKALIEDEKNVQDVIEGEIAAYSIDGNTITFEFKNQRHAFGYDIVGGGRHVVTWEAGGGFVRAPLKYRVNSPEELDNTIGPDNDRCWSGDALYFPDIPALSDVVLQVLWAEAFAGSQQENWGTETQRFTGTITGYYEPPGLGESRVVFPVVTRVSDVLTFTHDESETRPAVIATETYWVDPQTSRFIISEADKGDVCNFSGFFQPGFVAWSDNGITLGSNTTGDYSSNNAAFDTGLLDSTYGSLPRVVQVDGIAVEETGGSPVSGVSYKKHVDSAGHLVFLFHMGDSARSIDVAIETAVDQESPGDVAPVAGYGTGIEYGRNRDKAATEGSSWEVAQIAAIGDGMIGARVVCKRNRQVSGAAPFDFKATAFQTDEYATTLTSDYVARPGVGQWLQKKSVTDAQREIKDNFCYLFDGVRLWDHRDILSARHINQLNTAIDSTTRLLQALPIGTGPPLIKERLIQTHVFSGEGDFTADCLDFGNYKLNIGVVPQGPGLSYGDACFVARQRAHDLRFLDAQSIATTGNHDFITDYGYIDRSDISADDMTLGGCPSTPAVFTKYSGPQSGVGVPLPDPASNMGYVTDNAYLDADSGNAITAESWAASYAGTEGCPGSGTHFFSYGPSGPSQAGWTCGVAGNGIRSSHPYRTLASEPSLGNYIGCVHSIDFVGEGHVAPGSAIEINEFSGGFSFSELMKKLGNGGDVTKAMVRIKVAGYQAHEISTSQDAIDGDIIRTDTPSTRCSLVLIGGYMEPVTVDVEGEPVESGVYKWDILARGVGGEISDDNWRWVDCTDIIQAIRTTYRGNSRYTRYAFVPAPEGDVEVIFEDGNTDALLVSLASQFAYGSYVAPDHNPSVPHYQTGEGWYISSSSGRHCTWIHVQCDLILIELGNIPRLSNTGGSFIPGNMPPMD